MTTAIPAPTRLATGPAGIPPLDRTIGWHVIAWCGQWLQQPDGPEAGEPWRFTREQTRFVLWWYALRDDPYALVDGEEVGPFAYRAGLLRRMKGWGKDPLVAALAACEFLGPCRFDGFAEDGSPRARSHPAAWVQIAAVSQAQTRTTFRLFPAMFSPAAVDQYGIDLGLERIYALGGRVQIEAVTRSPKALEGARSTFVVKNETQHWLRSNRGEEMSEVLDRNSAKARDGSARVLGVTNAHRPGERSDAERDLDAYEAIKRGEAEPDLLYDSVEAEGVDIDDRESLRAGLRIARGDSAWVKVERLVAEIRSPKAKADRSRRFYLNQVAADADYWLERAVWAARSVTRELPPAGAQIAVGFDGSRYRDATAIVCTELATGWQWIERVWERPELAGDDWEVPQDEVDATMAGIFARWTVERAYCDPYWWEDTVSKWAGRWPGKVAFWWTGGAGRQNRVARAVSTYRNAIVGGECTHADDETFEQHITNAVRHELGGRDEEGEPLVGLAKDGKDSPRKIDAAMAGCLSWEASQDAIKEGALRRPGGISLYIPEEER